MQGLPIVRVDPDKPVCPSCNQNVDVVGGVIQPHGLYYNSLTTEYPKVVTRETKARRSFVVATAFCRRSNRPMPGEEVTKDEKASPPKRLKTINATDAILKFLFDNPNLGYTPRDIAFVCDLHNPRTGKLDVGLVTSTLMREKRRGLPKGFDLRTFKHEGKDHWAAVTT